jgi:Fe-S-cluster containining protein
MRFKCKGCGDCCRNFGDKDKCIPLFSWEVEEYKKLAKKEGIFIEFEPIKYLLDENSKIVFIYLYGIKNRECPFLKENRCSIYKERAIICRQFPLLWVASQCSGREFGARCLSECSNFNCKDDFERNFLGSGEASNSEIDIYLKDTYIKGFASALMSNKIGRRIVEIIGKHDFSKELKLKEISKEGLVNFPQMSFHEFLKFKGFLRDLEELEKIYYEKTFSINFKKHSL